MVRKLFQIATLITLFALPAQGEILFEGYSKITSGGVHVGYTVTRYEFDPKKKQFKGTYFLKTGSLGSDITESVKSVADESLNPISYEYTSLMGKKTKTIDAKFSKGKMNATVTEDGKTKTIRKDLPKGTFLSNFLIYLMLKSKSGLQTDARYEYSAIAEEDAEISKGDALVEKQETHMGQLAYKVLNRFKDVKFISYVSDRGEVLSTSSPANGIGTELVAKPSDAVGSFGVSANILKSLFGDVPLGTQNALSQNAKKEAFGETEPASKDRGIPGGKGILIKPAPAKESSK